jgi:hypothetical protein
LAVVAGGLTAGFFVVRIVFAGVAPRAGGRLAAARFGVVARFAVFLGAFARFLAGRVVLAAARFFAAAGAAAEVLAARAGRLAARRPVARGARRLGRLTVRLAAGRFLAFLAITV